MRRDWIGRDEKKHNGTGGKFCLRLIILSDGMGQKITKKDELRRDINFTYP